MLELLKQVVRKTLPELLLAPLRRLYHGICQSREYILNGMCRTGFWSQRLLSLMVAWELDHSEHGKREARFLSGAFHFSGSDIAGIPDLGREDSPRELLVRGQFESFVAKMRDIYPDRRPKRIRTRSSHRIHIGFFCSYAPSCIFEWTINSYSEFNREILWTLCTIEGISSCKEISFPLSVNHIHFRSISEAVEYADEYFDFVCDADGPLRYPNHLDVIQGTSCLTLNCYNLITGSGIRSFDVFLRPEGVDIPDCTKTERFEIALPAAGSWSLPKLPFEGNPSKRYDLAIACEQFKLDERFVRDLAFLSKQHTFCFIGMKFPFFLSRLLFEFGWNMRNVRFIHRMDFETFRRFLQESCHAVLDVPAYSGGSSTLAALSAGVPVVCRYGDSWLTQHSAHTLRLMSLEKFIYDDVADIPVIIAAIKSVPSPDIIAEIQDRAYESMYFKPADYLAALHVKLSDCLKRAASSTSRLMVKG